MTKKGQVRYLIETRFEPANNGGAEKFSQYKCYLTDKTDVLRIFGEYFSGKAIDVTGWTDITSKLNEQKN